MKRIYLISSFYILFSACSTTKNTEFKDAYWGVVSVDETYLYKAPNVNAVVYKEIKKGSILFVHTQLGAFTEVHTKMPNKEVDIEWLDTYRYYIKSSSFKKLTNKYRKQTAKLYVIPFDDSQSYVRGERGGCYFINRNGNKTYVERSFCSSSPTQVKNATTHKISKYKPSTSYRSKTRSKSVQCSGRTQKGTRCKNKTKNASGRCHVHS